MTHVDLAQLSDIALIEFSDITAETLILDVNELRTILTDGSFLDVWFSLKLHGRYSYHWERRALDGTIYRHDNAPHQRWQAVSTFPRHFHNGDELCVEESKISEISHEALRHFLAFIRHHMASPERNSHQGDFA